MLALLRCGYTKLSHEMCGVNVARLALKYAALRCPVCPGYIVGVFVVNIHGHAGSITSNTPVHIACSRLLLIIIVKV